jgi:hypothetical protein
LILRASTATNQKVGSSTLSGRATFFPEKTKPLRDFPFFPTRSFFCTHARDGPRFERESAEKIASGSSWRNIQTVGSRIQPIAPANYSK